MLVERDAEWRVELAERIARAAPLGQNRPVRPEFDEPVQGVIADVDVAFGPLEDVGVAVELGLRLAADHLRCPEVGAVVGGDGNDRVESSAVEDDPGGVNGATMPAEAVRAHPLLVRRDAQAARVVGSELDGRLPLLADRTVCFQRAGEVDAVVEPLRVHVADVPVVIAGGLDHEVERQDEGVEVALRVKRQRRIGRVHPGVVTRKNSARPMLATVGRVVPNEPEEIIVRREESLRQADDVIRIRRIDGHVALASVVRGRRPSLRADIGVAKPGRALWTGHRDRRRGRLGIDDSGVAAGVAGVGARRGRHGDE